MLRVFSLLLLFEEQEQRTLLQLLPFLIVFEPLRILGIDLEALVRDLGRGMEFIAIWVRVRVRVEDELCFGGEFLGGVVFPF